MILVLENDLLSSAKRLSDRDLHNQLYILMDCWYIQNQPQGRNTFRMPRLEIMDLNAIAYHYLKEWQQRNQSFAVSALAHPLAEVGMSEASALRRTRIDAFTDYIPHHRGFARYLGELDRLKKRARIHIGRNGNLPDFLADYGINMSGRDGRGYSSPDCLRECHQTLDQYRIPALANHYDQYYSGARLFHSYTGPGL